MIRSWRSWVLAFAVIALALSGGAAVPTGDGVSLPTLSISPEGVLAGKTLDAGEPFEMTLHLQGGPETAYDLAVTYLGAIGACQADAAMLTTNPEGKADWTCELATSSTPGTGTVTFAVSKDGVELAALVATLTVGEPAEEPGTEPEEEPAPAPEKADNHGQCVSYWAHRAKAEGLLRSAFGHFVSAVAQSDCTGVDPEEFSGALADAKAAQEAALAAEAPEPGARGHGKPGGETPDDE